MLCSYTHDSTTISQSRIILVAAPRPHGVQRGATLHADRCEEQANRKTTNPFQLTLGRSPPDKEALLGC